MLSSKMGTVFSEISSFKFSILEVIEENAYSKNITHHNKELIKLGFIATVVLVSIFV